MTQEELAAELDAAAQAAAAPRIGGNAAGDAFLSGKASGLLSAANLIRTTPIETEGEKKMREALERIVRRTSYHPDDTPDDQARDCRFANSIARAALGGQQ